MTTRASTGPTTHGQDASGVRGQDEGQRDEDEALEREPQERARA